MGCCISKQSLPLATPDLKDFSLKGYTCPARVVQVLDGDTIRVVAKISLDLLPPTSVLKGKGYFYAQFCIRLYGVDAAEKKTEKGKVAKKVMEDLVNNQIVDVEFLGKEKFGRELAKVLIADKDISEYMIAYRDDSLGRLAVPYTGGKKEENI